MRKKSTDETTETGWDSSAIRERRAAATQPDEHWDLRERIARRAYEIYEERGRRDGEDMNDWLRAEAEVKSWIAAKESAPAASRARARQ